MSWSDSLVDEFCNANEETAYLDNGDVIVISMCPGDVYRDENNILFADPWHQMFTTEKLKVGDCIKAHHATDKVIVTGHDGVYGVNGELMYCYEVFPKKTYEQNLRQHIINIVCNKKI